MTWGQVQARSDTGVAFFPKGWNLTFPPWNQGGEGPSVRSYRKADLSPFLGSYLLIPLSPSADLPGPHTLARLRSTPAKRSWAFQLQRSQLAELVISPVRPVNQLSSPPPAGVRFPC